MIINGSLTPSRGYDVTDNENTCIHGIGPVWFTHANNSGNGVTRSGTHVGVSNRYFRSSLVPTCVTMFFLTLLLIFFFYFDKKCQSFFSCIRRGDTGASERRPLLYSWQKRLTHINIISTVQNISLRGTSW